MRHYDDRDYGDICSPRVRCKWFDWATVAFFMAVVVYACMHKWLHLL